MSISVAAAILDLLGSHCVWWIAWYSSSAMQRLSWLIILLQSESKLWDSSLVDGLEKSSWIFDYGHIVRNILFGTIKLHNFFLLKNFPSTFSCCITSIATVWSSIASTKKTTEIFVIFSVFRSLPQTVTCDVFKFILLSEPKSRVFDAVFAMVKRPWSVLLMVLTHFKTDCYRKIWDFGNFEGTLAVYDQSQTKVDETVKIKLDLPDWLDGVGVEEGI